SQAGVRDSAGAAAAASGASTSAPGSTTVPGASPTTTTAAAATTTARPTTTTTTRAAGPTTTAAPAGPRALTPPGAGIYRYDTSGATTVAGTTVVFPAVTTLAVDPPSGTVQHSTRNLRNAAGDGTATEFTLDYRPAGVYLVGLRLTTGFSGMTDVRDLSPASAVLLLPTGARAGTHLESNLAAGGGVARLVVDVLGGERVAVGGQAVDTLVMRAVVTLPPGDITGSQQLTVDVDPGSRLWVREHGVADASAAGGLVTLHSDYTATLQRLTP
ncbi:MAG: hypothetical protein M3066_00270, partial [Actinomycetota bacterium]|nr:hypothetical protein [Actinomycetota bacterium]